MTSLEGIPCFLPATANSDPGSVEGQPSGILSSVLLPGLCLHGGFLLIKLMDKGADFPYKLLIFCPVYITNIIVLQTVSVSLQKELWV